jgi:monoamine oxidase
MAAKFERLGGIILVGRNVRSVGWRRGAVTLRGERGDGEPFDMRAARAVITLPLGVLHAAAVQFHPEPAAILGHARRMRMGHAMRMTLRFRHRFWAERSLPTMSRSAAAAASALSFLFSPGEPLPTWWTPMPDTAPLLTAWAAGPRAARLEAAADEGGRQAALGDACLRTLGAISGLPVAELESLLSGRHFHDWSADPFARGAYSYVPAGALDASERMAEPVADTLFFAGEHTDTSGHWGTVHGAIRSGQRAARQCAQARSVE